MSIVDGLSGRYRDLEKLGEGAMGEVWRGVDRMLEREVAIKLLRPELKSRPEFLERFRNEAVSMARINHPNIVGVYEFAQVGDLSWIAMEFVPGGTLESLLTKYGRFGWVEACDLIQQALLGLEHAHAAGILHRDIKPANVMVTPERVVKLGDFGIARISQGAKLTRVGHAMVTLEYAAPERLKGVETDARADLYSMGVILYELLVGKLPFSGTTDYEIMRSHAEAPIPVLDHLALGAPREMQGILAKALCKDPDGRYVSAADFRRALEQLRDRAQRDTREEVTVTAGAPGARRAASRRPVGVVATLAASLALGLGIAFWPKPAAKTDGALPPAAVAPGSPAAAGPAGTGSGSTPELSARPVAPSDPESERQKVLAAAKSECAGLVSQAREAQAKGDYESAQRLARKSQGVFFNCEGSDKILQETERLAAARVPKPAERRPAAPADRTASREPPAAVTPPVHATPAAPPQQTAPPAPLPVPRPPPVLASVVPPPATSSDCTLALAGAEDCLKDSQYTCAMKLAGNALQKGDCPAAKNVLDRAIQARNAARRNQPEIQ